MGTLFTFSAPEAEAASALEAALDRVAELEACISNWQPTSELSRLNEAGSAEHVSEPLRAILDSALTLAELTGGTFDPTVESLTRAWDLRGAGHVPGERELADALARVDRRRVRVDGQRVRLGGAQLDLGGIGKGFALDWAAHVLSERGIRAAMLDAGGQRLDLGAAERDAWVAHPAHREKPIVRLVLGGGSLSTSSQSERFVRTAGRRLGHVLDPRTGRPLATSASATVWAPSGTRADALSTALLVMGRDGAAAFALAHPEVGVLWLEPSGRHVRAEAWNLRVFESAPAVRLTVHSPPSSLTPLTQLTRTP